jgi:dTDP-4-dehydrorhamnose 3,5-epimerase
MSRFSSASLPLAGLKLVERQRLGDDRGFLSRMFCAEELAESGWQKPIAQISHTYTCQKGTVRGLHFQYYPHAEMKLVSVIRGELWDVAVDLREGSPTYLQWHGETLSAQNNRAMLIPEGFAHGFQAVTDDVEILYCHSAAYSEEAEGGLNPMDTKLNIKWPLPISRMSSRDQSHPFIDDEFTGLSLQ